VNQEPSDQTRGSANGAAVAAFLSAGIGAFTLGLIVILNEAGWLVVPGWYPPAGGVSGRTTLAVVLWLIAWAVLHRRWRRRQRVAGCLGFGLRSQEALPVHPQAPGLLPGREGHRELVEHGRRLLDDGIHEPRAERYADPALAGLCTRAMLV